MTISFSEDNERFSRITEEMYATYQKKNADYGNALGSAIDSLGFVAGVTLLHIKVSRAKSLLVDCKEAQVKDESIVDTLTDLANYAILLRMEVEKRLTQSSETVSKEPQMDIVNLLD